MTPVRTLAAAAILLMFFGLLQAQPSMSVSDGGTSGGNQLWTVEVAPDPALFTNTVNGLGGSLSVELGFDVTVGTLVGATINATDFPFDNPGNNPFTSSVTLGLQTDVGGGTVYASLGSEFLTSGSDVVVLTIETMGTASTTMTWGGHSISVGDISYTGSRIAQGGDNFDAYMGSLTLGGAMVLCDIDGDSDCDIDDMDLLYDDIDAGTAGGPADIDGSGTVDNDDIDDWLAEAGTENSKIYLPGDTNLDGDVGGADFTALASNFGDSGLASARWGDGNFNGNAGGIFDVGGSDFTALASNFGHTSVASVPEPASLVSILLGMIGVMGVVRRRP